MGEGAVEVPRGKRKDPGVEVHGEEGVVVALVELVAAGGIERRIRKISGGQEAEMNVEEMMMVLLQGVVRHPLEEVPPLGEDLLQEGVIAEPGGEEMLLQKVLLPDVEEEEMMVLQEGDHHQEEILVVKEMVVARGGPVLLEKSLEVIVLQGGVEEILVKGGVLLQGARVTVHHQEEDLLPGEISEEMMTGEEVLHVVHLLKEELGVAVGIGLLLGEDPLLDVLLLEEALHQGVVALLPAEEAVTMDLLTGAVATVQLLLLLPLLVMNLPQLNPGQPVKNQTQAGQPSSVNPPPPGIVRAVSTLSDCPVITSWRITVCSSYVITHRELDMSPRFKTNIYRTGFLNYLYLLLVSYSYICGRTLRDTLGVAIHPK